MSIKEEGVACSPDQVNVLLLGWGKKQVNMSENTLVLQADDILEISCSVKERSMAALKHEARLWPGVWRQVFFLLCLARRLSFIGSRHSFHAFVNSKLDCSSGEHLQSTGSWSTHSTAWGCHWNNVVTPEACELCSSWRSDI